VKFPLLLRSREFVEDVTDPLTPPSGLTVTEFVLADGLSVDPL